MEIDLNSQPETKMIFFSALAADANIFVPQKLAFPQLVVPSWPNPASGESLAAYCDRIAVQFCSEEPYILGGVSFGGIVALHVAQRVKTKAVILISSIQSPHELPKAVRGCRWLKPFLFLLPIRCIQFLFRPLATHRLRCLPAVYGFSRYLRRANPQLIKWSLARVLDWDVAPRPDCPVFHIHGDRDWILPLQYTRPTKIVPGGGHLLTLSHPNVVNDFIREVILQTA